MSDGSQEGSSEQLMGWLIILGIVLASLFFVYKNFTPEAHNIVRWVRYVEIWFITLVTPDSYSVTLPSGEVLNVKEWHETMAKIPKEQLNLKVMGAITAIAMLPIKYISMGIIALLGVWILFRGPGTQYRTVFNLDSFIDFQSKAFPIISPFVRFNPSNQPPRAPGSPVPAELPIFAEALGPEEWLAYNQIPIKGTEINKNALFKTFARQLGPRWQGAMKLAPYKQILLAVCCLKASRKREQADDMIGRLARCWSHDKGLRLGQEQGLLKEARKVLKNKELSHATLKNCNQHAWQTTALLRALSTAREEGGVIAPATFVWLRAHDRNLWYPLNNLGRQSNHTEAIGAMAHYKQEKRVQRPIPKPKVQDAVTSVVEYMNDGTARPVPALDYSQSSNKRGIKKVKS